MTPQAPVPLLPPSPRKPMDEAPTAGRRRRGLLVVVGVVALLVVAAVLAAGVFAKPAPPAAAPGTTDRSAGPAPAPAVFAPPVALPADGSYSTSELTAGGDVVVTQWIRSSTGVGRVRLAVPRVPGLDRSAVTATGLLVTAGRRQVATGSVGSVSPVVVDLGGAHEAVLSYVLSGVLDRDGSDPGRALARVVTLDLGYASPAALQATHAVTGARVLALGCTPRGAAPTACGAPVDGVWQVVLTGHRTRDRVQAQLELPRS